jgi:hypothetical protein
MERGADLPKKQVVPGTPKGKNYLLAIGIDKYKHWPVLQNAVKDAKDIIEVLTTQYQFEADFVYTLFDEKATESNIYQTIRDLKRKITPDDNLLVYYSGHGHYDKDFDEGHWIPVEADTKTEDRYISNSNIIKRINAIDAHHVFMIVDSCFSGSLVVANRSFLADEHYRSRRIFSSGRLEAVSDGSPGHNSPFASLLLARLKRNTDKFVNTTDLVQYVKKTIAGKSSQAPVDGRIQNSKDEGGEFVFHLKVDENDLWNNVIQENTIEAFENYLSYYPEGLYVLSAKRKLLALKEEGVWKSAKAKDNETAYRDYLQKYAGTGQYLAEAQSRLKALQERNKKRRETLEKLAKQDAEQQEIQHKFQSLIQKAEQLFASEKLEEARGLYRESLQYHMEGFAPSYDYIEQQINFCTNGITFLQHYQNGEKAMGQGNYRLAVQYLLEASKISDDPKIDDLIKVCRQRMKRPVEGTKETRAKAPKPSTRKQQQPVTYAATTSASHKPAAKKKGNYKWLAGGIVGFTLLILVVAFINGMMQSQEATTYNELILGSWTISDVWDANGNSFRQGGAPYTNLTSQIGSAYNFQQNNQVFVNSTQGSGTYPYLIYGDVLTIQYPDVSTSGSITYIDNAVMQVSYLIPDGYGGTYIAVFVLERGY